MTSCSIHHNPIDACHHVWRIKYISSNFIVIMAHWTRTGPASAWCRSRVGVTTPNSKMGPTWGPRWVTTPNSKMGPTWGPSGADRSQVGPMLAPWTVLSGTSIFAALIFFRYFFWPLSKHWLPIKYHVHIWQISQLRWHLSNKTVINRTY